MGLRKSANQNDHIQGSLDAPVIIVEYGDYECPYCRRAYPVLKEVQKRMGNKIAFVFRNFPLYNVHEHALDAAVASEVANDMGKFWEMHDILYENNEYLSMDDIVNYAENIGLDREGFVQKFNSPTKYESRIEDDIEGGLRSGVNGTPSIFINGEFFEGNPYSADDIIRVINEIIE